MPQANPTTKTFSTTDLRQQLESLLRQVADGETHAVIEEDGRPVAALVSINELRRLHCDRDFQALEDFSRGFEDIPISDLEQEVAKALGEVRAERREQRERSTSGR